MVDVYDQIKTKFSIDEYSHYLCTPRDLTKWTLGLLRYELDSEDLLDVWTYEIERLFKDRVVDDAGRQRFDKILEAILKAQWNGKSLTAQWFSTFGVLQNNATTTATATTTTATATGDQSASNTITTR